MYQVLRHAYDYIRTGDEKYLNDKYMKGSSYALQNFIENLNIPEFADQEDERIYREATLKVIKLWMDSEAYKNHTEKEKVEAKKELDEKGE